MTDTAFKLDRREILGFCLLALRSYEATGPQVEIDSLGDFERRALSRTLGTFWPALPASVREQLLEDLRESLGEHAADTFRAAVIDLQERARVEREIAGLPRTIPTDD